MAFADGEWNEVWSSTTYLELRDQLLMLGLTTQEFSDPWVNGAHEVHIPIPTWSTVTAASRDRGGNWGTVTDTAETTGVLTRSGGYASAEQVLWEDGLELPWPAVEQTRSRMTYQIAKEIDKALFALVTTHAGTAVDLGSTTDYIARATPYAASTAAAKKLPFTCIQQFATKAKRAGAIGGAGDTVGELWCIMAPEVFAVLGQYVLEAGYSFDRLTESVLTGPSVLTGSAWEGRLFGVDIYSSPLVVIPETDAKWTVLCGGRRGYASAVRPPVVQYFPPEQNQVSTQPAHLLRQAGDYAGIGLDATYFSYFTLHCESS